MLEINDVTCVTCFTRTATAVQLQLMTKKIFMFCIHEIFLVSLQCLMLNVKERSNLFSIIFFAGNKLLCVSSVIKQWCSNIIKVTPNCTIINPYFS